MKKSILLASALMQSTGTLGMAKIVNVPQDCDLQTALYAAQPGDRIVVSPGDYAGQFRLPNKPGDLWITVENALSASGTLFPGEGVRVDPGDSTNMPRLRAAGSGPVITSDPGAHHYRFIGIEITTGQYVDQLVQIGSATESSIGQLPHHYIFERCYIHGHKTYGAKRGIAMNGGDGKAVRTGNGAWPNRIDWAASTGGIQVLDSYLSDFKHTSYDTQALASWNGAGPFLIQNNYLEAAGENVMFGGADPSIYGLVPADIEVVRNQFFKPLAWNKWDASYAGTNWAVKNIFELKNARRVLVDGNVLENNWVDDQNGFAILFTPRNQNGRAPWSAVQEVRFTNNIVRHVSAGINILGEDDTRGRKSGITTQILISNNLFEDVDHDKWGGSTTTAAGRLFHILQGAVDVTIDHNTAIQSRAVSFSTGTANIGFKFTSNVTRHAICGSSNNCGIAGDRTKPGNPTLDRYFPAAIVTGNIMYEGNEKGQYVYPTGNTFPATNPFRDLSVGDYHLTNAPLGYDTAGADLDVLYSATKGVAAAPAP